MGAAGRRGQQDQDMQVLGTPAGSGAGLPEGEAGCGTHGEHA